MGHVATKQTMNEKFIQIIQTQIEELKNTILLLAEGTKPIQPDVAIGRLSRMEAIGEKSVKEANLRKSKLRLVELKKALVRINDGDFGECINCGELIEEKRLEIIPESTVCMKCLNKQG